MGKTTINVSESPEQTPLLAVSFSNGNLKSSHYHQVTSKLYESKKETDKCKLVVRAGDMDYLGDFNCSKLMHGQFIGVEDPETRIMNMYPIKRVKIRPAISMDPGGDIEELPTSNTSSYWQQRDALTAAFGDSRHKRDLNLKQKHGLDNSVVAKALEGSRIDEVDLKHKQQDILEGEVPLLPPHDTEAKTPQEAYPVSGFFPDSVRDELELYCSDFQEFTTQDLQKFSARSTPYIIDKLKRLPLDNDSRKKQYASLLFLNALLALNRMPMRKLGRQKDLFKVESEDDLLYLPSDTVAHIERTFITHEARRRSISSKDRDRLLIHVVLMALYIERYSLPVEPFIKDAKILPGRLANVVKAMGCQITSTKKNSADKCYMVSMKLPLRFPSYEPSAKRKRQ